MAAKTKSVTLVRRGRDTSGMHQMYEVISATNTLEPAVGDQIDERVIKAFDGIDYTIVKG